MVWLEPMLYLSFIQAQAIVVGLNRSAQIEVSLDLELTQGCVRRDGDAAVFPDGQRLAIGQVDKIAKDHSAVYVIEADAAEKLARFSDQTQKLYKLRPTQSWPALEISGVLMHRISGTDPQKDVHNKIEALAPLHGRVLDTCFGLGYTAIGAAATAASVTSVEVDPNVLALARLNPYSRRAFEDPKIKIVHDDAARLIEESDTAAFNTVIHDPPTLSVAGGLYADAFYHQLHRVLGRGGKLLHYTGAPGSKYRGVDLPRRVSQRLKTAGFRRVAVHPLTLSVLAWR